MKKLRNLKRKKSNTHKKERRFLKKKVKKSISKLKKKWTKSWNVKGELKKATMMKMITTRKLIHSKKKLMKVTNLRTMAEAKLKNQLITKENPWVIRGRKKPRNSMIVMATMTNMTKEREIHTVSHLAEEESKSTKKRKQSNQR